MHAHVQQGRAFGLSVCLFVNKLYKPKAPFCHNFNRAFNVDDHYFDSCQSPSIYMYCMRMIKNARGLNEYYSTLFLGCIVYRVMCVTIQYRKSKLSLTPHYSLSQHMHVIEVLALALHSKN